MRKYWYIWTLVLLAVIILVLWLVLRNPKNTRYAWDNDYNPESWQPYGVALFYNLLDRRQAGGQCQQLEGYRGISLDYVRDKGELGSHYIVFGESDPDFWTSDFEELARDGYHLHFFVDEPSTGLLELFYDNDRLVDPWHYREVRVATTHQFRVVWPKPGQVQEYARHANDSTPVEANWLGFAASGGLWAHEVATFEDSQRFAIRSKFGEGSMSIYLNTFLLSNHHLKRQDGFAFAQGLTAPMVSGDIYWDRCHDGAPETEADQSLSYLLSKPGYALGWYILLGLTLIYVLFYARRRQRVIPVLRRRQNISLDFAKGVGDLYFGRSQPMEIAGRLLADFEDRARHRYHLSPKLEQPEFVHRLAKLTGLSPQELQQPYDEFDELSHRRKLRAVDILPFCQHLEILKRKLQ